MINVAVLGYGTVGSGVVEVIEKNKDMVNKKSAQELEVKYILDLRDFPGDPYENKVIHDFNTILQDDSVTIICETMGGVGAAYQFTKQALELGNRTLMMDAGRIVFDVKGAARSKMTVDDLLEKFRENAGKNLDNDRILLSKVEK